MRSNIHALPGTFPLALVPVFIGLAGCSSGEKATTDSATTKAADTAAAAAPAMFASAGATDSMKTPESVRYDADLDAYFVSTPMSAGPSTFATTFRNAPFAITLTDESAQLETSTRPSLSTSTPS